ncbi:hypothetical protein H6761_00520 [Candidatus Nomurabacteria bacterium]|nr:hypothetical protein [Candidatus Nomurabacteria bacterium]
MCATVCSVDSADAPVADVVQLPWIGAPDLLADAAAPVVFVDRCPW